MSARSVSKCVHVDIHLKGERAYREGISERSVLKDKGNSVSQLVNKKRHDQQVEQLKQEGREWDSLHRSLRAVGVGECVQLAVLGSVGVWEEVTPKQMWSV